MLVTGRSRSLPPDSPASGDAVSAAPSRQVSGDLADNACPVSPAPMDRAPECGAQDLGLQGNGGPATGKSGGAPGGGKGEKAAGGHWAVDVEHRGPSVVLWLWEAVAGGGEVVLRPQPIRFTAGPEGAPPPAALRTLASPRRPVRHGVGQRRQRCACRCAPLRGIPTPLLPSTHSAACPVQAPWLHHGAASAWRGRGRLRAGAVLVACRQAAAELDSEPSQSEGSTHSGSAAADILAGL